MKCSIRLSSDVCGKVTYIAMYQNLSEFWRVASDAVVVWDCSLMRLCNYVFEYIQCLLFNNSVPSLD